MNLLKDKNKQRLSDYHQYLKLKKLHHSNALIAKKLGYSKEDFGFLLSRFAFEQNIGYKLQEQEGDYHFKGKFYVTSNAKNVLTTEEILEIYRFTQDLVKQHKGIDYLQVFFSFEQNCKLFFIDQLSQKNLKSGNYPPEQNYCTLMLASDY